MEGFSEGSRGEAGTWTLSGCVGDVDGNGERDKLPELVETWGCRFSAGRRWAWLTLRRLQPPKSLSVPCCSHGDPQHTPEPSPAAPEPAWAPRGWEIPAGLWITAPSRSTQPSFHTSTSQDVNCPEENPALRHSSAVKSAQECRDLWTCPFSKVLFPL